MAQIFKRYPRGGAERLLALALGDCANPDGTRIFPSVETLATMTMQSARTVQRQISVMLATGWLILVRASSGRRGDCNEYRISPEWLAGQEPAAPPVVPDRRTVSTGDKLSPVGPGAGIVTGDRLSPLQPVYKSSTLVDNLSTTGDTQGLSGDIAVSPNPSLPVNTDNPLTPVGTGECGKPEIGQPGAKQSKPPWRWRDSLQGYVERGKQLGIEWSTRELGTAWTDEQLRQHQAAYRQHVDDEHARRERNAGQPPHRAKRRAAA